MFTSRCIRQAMDMSKVQALNLDKATSSTLSAFRQRYSEAQRNLAHLKQQPTQVDVEHYRSILKNQSVLDETANILKTFKPVTYDVNDVVKGIAAYEAKAIKSAQDTTVKLKSELKTLKDTLQNIKESRPFEDLTTQDVLKVKPELDKAIEEAVRQGKQSVPGYDEKFPSLSVI